MNQLPNIITSVRLFAAIALICFSLVDAELARASFLTLFALGGVSDMLDGWTARTFNWCSEFGARLDSISDLVFYLAVVVFLSLHAAPLFAPSFPYLAVGLSLQLFHWSLAQVRHGCYPAYHSSFSRLCAYGMFFTMLAFWYLKLPILLSAMIIAWIVCCLEGITITLILGRAETNVSSVSSALALRRNHAQTIPQTISQSF